MIFQELNRGKCKTYAVACEQTRKALLIDPLRGNVDRYIAWLAYQGLTLEAVTDTHTHADHPTACTLLNDLTGARILMHTRAPSPRVTQHLEDGDTIEIGKLGVKALYTPGHTPDSLSFHVGDRVFTGDVILIGGTGRTDFAGGDAGDQYDSIIQKLFTLPDETLMYPGHDYRGNIVSTIGAEKRSNPRVAGRTRAEYVELMNNLKFPLPENIQEVLQPNQSAIEDDSTRFPDLAQLNQVRQLTPQEVQSQLKDATPPLLIDVRERQEYWGELGHIAGSQLVPLAELAMRSVEFEALHDRPIICICRSGVRSTTAAAILTGLGFEQVANLKGGMLDWRAQSMPTAG
jgi:glyoxylase-like metal-dependent hydrolase (beta-lactamase superfamily II)/rhodanese-related sulfurtransferase